MNRTLASIDKSTARRARTLPRAAATSDVTRARDVLLAALVAAMTLGAGLALVPAGSLRLSPGPLARPHVEAGLACASCHAAGATSAAGSCAGCHGTHGSTRAGHQRLLARGELGCVDCHAAHGTAEGITFLSGDRFVRWGAGPEETGAGSGPAGATVPFVPLAACSRCHDLASPRDPAARCSSPSPAGSSLGISLCFDEHQAPTDTAAAPGRIACAHQHGPSRFAAWEAAAPIAQRATRLAAGRGSGAWWAVAVAFAAGVSAFAAIGAARHSRRSKALPSQPLARTTNARLPQINASTCLGCYACVDACPFDVLEIQRYVAVVARPADCCGVVLCQQVCPNGSLTIAEGAPIEHRLRLDEHLESLDAPGVFVAGDLGGVPLIKNAIAQGVRAVDRVADGVPRRVRGGATCHDVVIVGAGPAGLSAALRAQELGLSYVCLEQGTVASSIRSFPRNKLVFDQPLNLPVEGDLWLQECTKEELLAQWARIVRRRKLAIREGCRVTDIGRSGADFVVTTSGETFSAARLILAIGKRGTPRTLGCAIDDAAAAKVSYSLADARSFASQRVLIVGLGDSAMEAAIAIARQPGTTVAISYRGKDFARGRARNVAEVKALVARGRLRIAFDSSVTRVNVSTVELTVSGRAESLPNDAVLVLIGGTPSWDLLQRAGVASNAVVADVT